MNRYYLMAQLPSLEVVADAAPLPITEEHFTELCGRFLGKKTARAIEELTLVPSRIPERSGFAIIDEWNDGERRLRLALAKARAERMNKPFDTETIELSSQIREIAKTAVGMKDPLAAEQYLNAFRLGFLETLRPADMFSEASVLCYALRLKLLTRMRRFDAQKGRDVYKNKYSSIIRGGEEVNE